MIAALVWVLVLGVGTFSLLFLGGMASAAWENHRERKAGLPVTRPAWEARDKRRAVPWRERVSLTWQRARFPGVEFCWCNRGTLDVFPALDAFNVEGVGCTAWEAGDPLAIVRHDLAGGYARVPVPAGGRDR